jgi:hypothetical protein
MARQSSGDVALPADPEVESQAAKPQPPMDTRPSRVAPWLHASGKWIAAAILVPAVLIVGKAGADAYVDRSKHEGTVPHIALTRAPAAGSPISRANDQVGFGDGASVANTSTGAAIAANTSSPQANDVIEVHVSNPPPGATADNVRIDVIAGAGVVSITSPQPGRIATQVLSPDAQSASITLNQLPVGDEAIIEVTVRLPQQTTPSDSLGAIGVGIAAVCRNCEARAQLQ